MQILTKLKLSFKDVYCCEELMKLHIVQLGHEVR